MKSTFSSFFSFQTPPPGSQEGLPYWTLWFFLCIILLLLTFIFLRDKDLRQRLNRFLFGAKKKLIKLRLQARLKMAKRKKRELHRELGQKIWDERLDVQGAEKISTTLEKLMESKASLLDELVEMEIKISKLKKSLDEKNVNGEIKISGQKTELKIHNERLISAKEKTKTRRSLIGQKRKEAEKITKNIAFLKKEHLNLEKISPLNEEQQNSIDRMIKQIEEAENTHKDSELSLRGLKEKLVLEEEEEKDLIEKSQEEGRRAKKKEDEQRSEAEELKKEISEWERNKVRVQEKIEKIEKRTIPLFENLGVLADHSRLERKTLLLNYSQIDRTRKRISDIEQQLIDIE
ncbi:MAG: hypothetical protein MUP98_08325 [Candidatus Aminicenantes bacterium]|nr:hypothetical protein [Candidatus Aminicenantes bacterium]